MLIDYICSKCSTTAAKFFRAKKPIPDTIECKCGGELERQLAAPSSKSTQIIDNGIMARQVEVMGSVVEKESDQAKFGDD